MPMGKLTKKIAKKTAEEKLRSLMRQYGRGLLGLLVLVMVVHDVFGDRRVPGRNAGLHVGFAILWHAREEPADTERGGVIDRHTPFEVIAGEQCIRPQADAADRP